MCEAVTNAYLALWGDPEKSAFLNRCPVVEGRLLATFALKAGLIPQIEVDDDVMAEALEENHPTISPYTHQRFSRGAPWLGEETLAYLKELQEGKFYYLEELIGQQPQECRDEIRDGIYRILGSWQGGRPIAAYRVNAIRRSKRLGTTVILDSGDECSEIALEHMLKSIGFQARARFGGVSGVGVRIIEGSRQFQVPMSEVKAHPKWEAQVSLPWSLPLPMGMDDTDRPFVLDLSELNCLVNISADRAGMTDFIDPIVIDLAKSRKPTDVRFLTVDSTDWVLSWLWHEKRMPRTYMLGEKSPKVEFDGDANEIVRWCAHAKRQLDLFKNELATRERLFVELGAEDFSDYRNKAKHPVPHWVLCIAYLPFDGVGLGSAAYEAYQEVLTAAHEFMLSDSISRYGMHVIYSTYSSIDADTQLYLLSRMDEAAGIGVAVTYGNFDIADSYKMIGSPDATRVGGGRCVYRTPVGEIIDYCTSVAEETA